MENKWYSSITSYEEKGRNVVTSTIDKIFNGVKVVYNTEITDSIDLIAECEYKGVENKIGIELKCYNLINIYLEKERLNNNGLLLQRNFSHL